MNFNLLQKDCVTCGTSLPRAAKFCPTCGSPQNDATTLCSNCHQPAPASAKFCPTCGAPVSRQTRPTVAGNRWVRQPGDFATRIDVQDLPGFIKQELVVEPGANAVVIINGESRGVCSPGKYTLDSLNAKIGRLLNLDWVRTVTALLTDVTPLELEYTEQQLQDLFTRDPYHIGVSVRLVAEIESPALFLTALMKERQSFTVQELSAYIEPEVYAFTETWVGQQTLKGLMDDLELKRKYTQALEEALKATFKRYGLAFRDTRALRFTYEHADAQRRQSETFLLQVSQAEAELQQRQRLTDVQDQLELHTVTEEEKRIVLRERLQRAVRDGRLSEARSQEEFEQGLDQLDRQKWLRTQEREALERAWKESVDDHDRARGHVLARLEVEQKFDLEQVRLQADQGLGSAQLDHELQLARKKADYELEAARQKWTEELKIESDKRQQTLERARLESEVAALRREEQRGNATLAMELMAKLKELQRLDEAERQRQAREDLFARQKSEWAHQAEVFERDERERMSTREYELKLLAQMSTASAEALIAFSPVEQGAILADLKKTEALKGLSEEQILAAAAKDSPDVARAFQEKFRAISEGKASEHDREMYERLLGQKDKSAEETLRQMREMARDQKELAETAMKQIAEAAKGANPVVVAGSGASAVRGHFVQPQMPVSGQRTCPKCGMTVGRKASFCQECGYQFPGGK